MLLNELEIFVYKVDNYTFELLGTINKYSSLIWPDKFIGYGTFELWTPISEENNDLLKPGNILWIGLHNACIIELINPQKDKDGIKKYYVKGRSLEKFLEDRIVWGTYTYTSKATSTIMYDVVNKSCINPTDTKRKVPYLENYVDEKFGDNLTIQKTGGYVYDFLTDLVDETNLGFSVDFLPKEHKMQFRVYKGEDRTRTNIDGNLPIEISTEFDDILSSEYSYNEQNFKNVAFVQGEENEGEPRKDVTVGSVSLSGYERREHYVDARDLQSEVYDASGVERHIPEEEYLDMLTNRGNEKLAERVVEESLSAVVRQKGILQYYIGEDYNLGDFVSIIDEDIGASADVQVTNIQREYSDEYNVSITFGQQRPTIIDRIKKIVKQ